MSSYRFPLHISPLGAFGIPAGTTFENASPARPIRNEFLRAFGNDSSAVDGHRFPRADAREDATGYTLELDVPGFSSENIEVLAEEQQLLVRGTRSSATLSDGEKSLFAERTNGSFERRWRFPKSADLDSISATYVQGVLTLRIGKTEPAQPRKVTVNVPVPAQ